MITTLVEFNDQFPSSDTSAITLSSERLQVFITSIQGHGDVSNAWRGLGSVNGTLEVPF